MLQMFPAQRSRLSAQAGKQLREMDLKISLKKSVFIGENPWPKLC